MISNLDNRKFIAHQWYHGIISRRSAESVLRQTGDFLVRVSETQRGKLVISYVSADGMFKHVLIEHDYDLGYCLCDSSNRKGTYYRIFAGKAYTYFLYFCIDAILNHFFIQK